MLLYELAIALDKRSPELTEAGAELGLGDLQPATDLDAQQVAALRAHFGGDRLPPPLAPLGSGGSPPLPAVPSGPLPAEPMVFGGPPPPPSPPVGPPLGGPVAPVAPASWGPPTAPANWGPPPGALPPPPPAPGAETPHAGPSFAYPESPSAQVVDSPLGLGDATLPPPPQPPAPVPAPAAPGADGMGPGQKVLIGATLVAVLALFGFMLANTGPDEGRRQAFAAEDAAIEAELATTTAAAPTRTGYEPVDAERFCGGWLRMITFDDRVAAVLRGRDFAELASLVRDHRAAWLDDVSTMASGAAPVLVDDIERYRDGYDTFFEAIVTSSTMDEVYGKIDRAKLASSANAIRSVGAKTASECE